MSKNSSKQVRIPLNERLVTKGTLIEKDQKRLPDGVLCRAQYPICNIDELNSNKRVYGKKLWENVCSNEKIVRCMEDRNLFGAAEHPEKTQSNLLDTSHIITRTWINEDENVVYQEFDVLDTTHGRLINTLLRAGCKVGVSTRAEGALKEAHDSKRGKYFEVIPESYEYVTTDFTADPSTYNALPVKVEHNCVDIIKQGIDEKKIDSEFAETILENFKSKEAVALCESLKRSKPVLEGVNISDLAKMSKKQLKEKHTIEEITQLVNAFDEGTYSKDPEIDEEGCKVYNELCRVLGESVDKESLKEADELSTNDGPLVDDTPKEEPMHKFSCLQLTIPAGEVLSKIQELQNSINKDDLFLPEGAEEKFGIEDDIHVTVKYGIHSVDASEVFGALEGSAPVTLILGKVNMFESGEDSSAPGEKYDVVWLEVESDALRALNSKVCDSLECTDTKPEYTPHITLGYVKEGKGEEYMNLDGLDGTEVEVSDLVFSTPDGERESLSLVSEEPKDGERRFFTKDELITPEDAVTESVDPLDTDEWQELVAHAVDLFEAGHEDIDDVVDIMKDDRVSNMYIRRLDLTDDELKGKLWDEIKKAHKENMLESLEKYDDESLTHYLMFYGEDTNGKNRWQFPSTSWFKSKDEAESYAVKQGYKEFHIGDRKEWDDLQLKSNANESINEQDSALDRQKELQAKRFRLINSSGDEKTLDYFKNLPDDLLSQLEEPEEDEVITSDMLEESKKEETIEGLTSEDIEQVKDYLKDAGEEATVDRIRLVGKTLKAMGRLSANESKATTPIKGEVWAHKDTGEKYEVTGVDDSKVQLFGYSSGSKADASISHFKSHYEKVGEVREAVSYKAGDTWEITEIGSGSHATREMTTKQAEKEYGKDEFKEIAQGYLPHIVAVNMDRDIWESKSSKVLKYRRLPESLSESITERTKIKGNFTLDVEKDGDNYLGVVYDGEDRAFVTSPYETKKEVEQEALELVRDELDTRGLDESKSRLIEKNFTALVNEFTDEELNTMPLDELEEMYKSFDRSFIYTPKNEEELANVKSNIDKVRGDVQATTMTFAQIDLYNLRKRVGEAIASKKSKKTNESFEDVVKYLEQEYLSLPKVERTKFRERLNEGVIPKKLVENKDTTLSLMSKLELKEAITRAERDTLLESLEGLEQGIVNAALDTLDARAEVSQLRENLRESSIISQTYEAVSHELAKQLKEQEKKSSNDLEQLTEKLTAEKNEALNEQKRVLEEGFSKKETRQYLEMKINESGLKLNEKTLALLESCSSKQEIDEQLTKTRNFLREAALHYQAEGKHGMSIASTGKETSELEKSVKNALEGAL